jgi:hypothetical protein
VSVQSLGGGVAALGCGSVVVMLLRLLLLLLPPPLLLLLPCRLMTMMLIAMMRPHRLLPPLLPSLLPIRLISVRTTGPLSKLFCRRWPWCRATRRPNGAGLGAGSAFCTPQATARLAPTSATSRRAKWWTSRSAWPSFAADDDTTV